MPAEFDEGEFCTVGLGLVTVRVLEVGEGDGAGAPALENKLAMLSGVITLKLPEPSSEFSMKRLYVCLSVE